MSNALDMIWRCAARQNVDQDYTLPGCYGTDYHVPPTPEVLDPSDHGYSQFHNLEEGAAWG